MGEKDIATKKYVDDAAGAPAQVIPILDNQPVPVTFFSYAKTKRYAFHCILIQRGITYKAIYTQSVTDGTTVVGGQNTNSSPSPDQTGVTITKIVNGDNIEYQYTSTNLGVAGQITIKPLSYFN